MEILGMTLGLFALIVYLLLFVAWIYTLILQAQKKKWAWFVLTLIFPFVMLIYWVAKWLG
jgi:hypothetical protein